MVQKEQQKFLLRQLRRPTSARITTISKERHTLHHGKIQPKGEVFCGHLCLHVLKQLSLGRKLQDIVNDLH